MALPDLGLLALRAKVDTGARTSSLGAAAIERFSEGGAPWVRFEARPLRKSPHVVVACAAPVVDEREIVSSNGEAQTRIVIGTSLQLGLSVEAPAWPIEVTLASRSSMRFPMLLGREAAAGRLLVDPAERYLLGKADGPRSLYP